MTTTFDIQIAIGLVEDGTRTRATVTYDLGDQHFEAVGLARRSPEDPNVPEVGEELASSRAFGDLAHQLLEAATERIATFG